MAIDPLSLTFLGFILTINVFVLERMIKLERDLGYIKGYLKLNGNGGDPDGKKD